MLCFKTTGNCSSHMACTLVNIKWAHLWCDLFLFNSFTHLFIFLIICLRIYLFIYLFYFIHMNFVYWLGNRKNAKTDCRLNFSCCTVLYKLYWFRNSIICCIVFYPIKLKQFAGFLHIVLFLLENNGWLNLNIRKLHIIE